MRDGSTGLVFGLPRNERIGVIARRLISRHFGSHMGSEALMQAQIVVTELVNNAYQHGRGRIQLAAALRPGRLLVEVIDEGDGEAVRLGAPHGDSGRGLRIVDALSASWGVLEGSTHVWAELPI